MFKKFLFLYFLFFSASLLQAQNVQIPKIEYEYFSKSQSCEINPLFQIGPSPTHFPYPCFMTVPDFTSLGKEGWELVNTIDAYSRESKNQGHTNTVNIVIYTRTYIFKRQKPINEQQFYAQLNQIAKVQIDTAMNHIKMYLIAQLNKSTRELFSTEYASAMRDNILIQIRSEMKSAVDSVITASKPR